MLPPPSRPLDHTLWPHLLSTLSPTHFRPRNPSRLSHLPFPRPPPHTSKLTDQPPPRPTHSHPLPKRSRRTRRFRNLRTAFKVLRHRHAHLRMYPRSTQCDLFLTHLRTTISTHVTTLHGRRSTFRNGPP